MISTLPQATFGPVVVLLAAALYQRNLDGKHKLWNILLIERCILYIQVEQECCYAYSSGKM
jgi:hypothetical protein